MNFLKKLFRRNGDGETREFIALVDGAVEGLQLQTEIHQSTWQQFGDQVRWDLNQDDGDLVLEFPEVIVRAPAQVIGTFDANTGTWMWAWANPSVGDALMKDSLRVRNYGEEHAIERLVTPKWRADELDCWRMTALAARLCDTNGAYRGPVGSTYIFVTFGTVTMKRKA
jgi:hypothetical protein